MQKSVSARMGPVKFRFNKLRYYKLKGSYDVSTRLKWKYVLFEGDEIPIRFCRELLVKVKKKFDKLEEKQRKSLASKKSIIIFVLVL